ncbi:MAG TPA: DUF2393 family protein [Terriglobales bacterium]|jgi:hypothetical protein
MGGLIQPTPTVESPPESSWRPILIGLAIVVVVVGAGVLLLREKPKTPNLPPAYASNLRFSDLKMSAAENFVGATVSYIDGSVANAGDKTVVQAIVHVTFKDEMGQTVGDESRPLRILQTSGPYPDAVDLTASPLAPGQSKTFRLTFESISSQWNRQAPDIQVTDVVTR